MVQTTESDIILASEINIRIKDMNKILANKKETDNIPEKYMNIMYENDFVFLHG